jgi:hypothetical protein
VGQVRHQGQARLVLGGASVRLDRAGVLRRPCRDSGRSGGGGRANLAGCFRRLWSPTRLAPPRPPQTPPPPSAPATASVYYAAMTPAERRAQLAVLTAAMEGDGN